MPAFLLALLNNPLIIKTKNKNSYFFQKKQEKSVLCLKKKCLICTRNFDLLFDTPQ